jgi:pimeloyl-ACP methyl ester carboxylesterase
MSHSYTDLFVTAADGLRLYARDYGPPAGGALPVICLPGLTRNSEDFHELAEALSRDASRPRRVLSLDYRGRGRSEWDKDWRRYDLKVELDDCLKVLASSGIGKAVFVGTSRGGLIAMALGAAHPDRVAGIVLNDIGPVIEAKGLLRIRSYVGKLQEPRTLQEGAGILRRMSGDEFPAFTDDQWLRMARGTWHETADGPVLSYDANLMKTLEALDPGKPLPDLWPLFDSLKAVPTLVIRGGNSDLLSDETLRLMMERHPSLTAITVPGQGHAPSLDGDLIQTIALFGVGVDV